MSKLYLLQYNNYYNRQLRREDTIEAYEKYLVSNSPDKNGNSCIIENANFIDLDFTNTTQVVNWNGLMPNYLVEVDGDQIRSRWFVTGHTKQNYGQYLLDLHRDLVADYFDEIEDQPMFVEKAKPVDVNDTAVFNNEDMTFNQIKVSETLLKDNSGVPWIVGYIPNNAFADQDTNKRTISAKYSGTSNADVSYPGGIASWPYYKYLSGKKGTVPSYPQYVEVSVLIDNWNDEDNYVSTGAGTLTCYYSSKNAAPTYTMYGTLQGGGLSNKVPVEYRTPTGSGFKTRSGSSGLGRTHPAPNALLNDIPSGQAYLKSAYKSGSTTKYEWPMDLINSLYSDAHNYIPNLPNKDAMFTNIGPTIYSTWNNKIIHDEIDDSYYQVHVTSYIRWYGTAPSSTEYGFHPNYVADVNPNTGTRTIVRTPIDPSTDLGKKMQANFKGAGDTVAQYTPPVITGSPNNSTYLIGAKYHVYDIELIPVASDCSLTMPLPEDRYHLKDSPYDMFCMPYPRYEQGETLKVYSTAANGNRTTAINSVDGTAALQIAMGISATFGQEDIYDIQLLPYCPYQSVLTDEFGTIDVHGGRPYQEITDSSGNVINLMFFCSYSEFSLDLMNPSYAIPVENTVENIKIKHETEVYRLTSPNMSNFYNLDPQMNGGVQFYNVDCNYKPFSPYIHINPNFGKMFGEDFNDSRGLILGGDYSLPQITNAWADYQLQNKNYQEIFNRSEQNLTLNNAVQREKEKWQATAGIFSGVANGVASGAATGMAAGPWGALAGAAVGGLAGGLTSGIAARRDIELNERLRQESLDYNRDMFGYNLGNIQALPNGLARVSSFTANNKVFPFVEKYTCDLPGQTTQLDALKNKLKYNGYTIMRIGTINEFNKNDEEIYFKARLIRLPDSFPQDFHIGDALASELNKGIFLRPTLSLIGDDEGEE